MPYTGPISRANPHEKFQYTNNANDEEQKNNIMADIFNEKCTEFLREWKNLPTAIQEEFTPRNNENVIIPFDDLLEREKIEDSETYALKSLNQALLALAAAKAECARPVLESFRAGTICPFGRNMQEILSSEDKKAVPVTNINYGIVVKSLSTKSMMPFSSDPTVHKMYLIAQNLWAVISASQPERPMNEWALDVVTFTDHRSVLTIPFSRLFDFDAEGNVSKINRDPMIELLNCYCEHGNFPPTSPTLVERISGLLSPIFG
ncbi:MAG: hypothetical protein H7A37_00035 [Chlamydiales bacterium]|nr:hypothetical protein [Chlamydiales bacterium]